MKNTIALHRMHPERLHLIQEQLARRIGVTRNAVNPWGNDKSVPQPLLAQRILELS